MWFFKKDQLTRIEGIEPPHTVLKTVVLPLNYIPLKVIIIISRLVLILVMFSNIFINNNINTYKF